MSLPEGVTHSTSAEEFASPLLQVFLLLHIDADFLGPLCTTQVAEALLIMQGLYLSYFPSVPPPAIYSWRKGERLSIHSETNHAEHIS